MFSASPLSSRSRLTGLAGLPRLVQPSPRPRGYIFLSQLRWACEPFSPPKLCASHVVPMWMGSSNTSTKAQTDQGVHIPYVVHTSEDVGVLLVPPGYWSGVFTVKPAQSSNVSCFLTLVDSIRRDADMPASASVRLLDHSKLFAMSSVRQSRQRQTWPSIGTLG